MTRCPECGEPPHYHSFCTLCAQLFRVKPKAEKIPQRLYRIKVTTALRMRQVMAAHAAGLTWQQAAFQMQCSKETVRRWKLAAQLPKFARKLSGRVEHALDA